MTRLLAPDAFGLMAMVVIAITAFGLLSDVGIDRSIVREEDGENTSFLRVAWVVKIIRSLFIFLGVLLTAFAIFVFGSEPDYAGTVYADPRLPVLIAISSIVPLLDGAQATTKELAYRRMLMGRIVALEIGTQIATVVAMVSFAQINASVWALLSGMLFGVTLKCFLSHLVYQGPAMAFEWDREIVGRLWHFGKWIIGSSLFTFVALNADRLFLAAMLGSTSFGIYSISRLWIDAGKQVVGQLNSRVGFTSIGEVLRNRPGDARRVFRKFQSAIDALCGLSFLVVAIFGQRIMGFLYDGSYEQAGSYLSILSLTLLVARFDTLQGLILNIGDSRAAMFSSGIKAIAICASLPLSYKLFGLTGALFSVALSPLLAVPYCLWILKAFLGRQVWIEIAWVLSIFLAATLLLIIEH